jgi:phosphomannomutase
VEAALERAVGRSDADVAVNLTTSSVIDDVAARYGRRVYRTAVGEANVVERMRSVNALIGGEGSSGGIIFSGVHRCRDSYTGMALLLDRMAASGQRLSELAAKLPRYTRREGKSRFEHGKLGGLMLALQRRFPEAAVDRTDGLKLILDGAWIHLRASNTEPVLRVAVEAREAERAGELFRTAVEILKS